MLLLKIVRRLLLKATFGTNPLRNFKHVVINNGSHDSVGGQTTKAFDIDFCALARSLGYKAARSVSEPADLPEAIKTLLSCDGPALLEVRVRNGARSNLGRPKHSPLQNKLDFMGFLEQ